MFFTAADLFSRRTRSLQNFSRIKKLSHETLEKRELLTANELVPFSYAWINNVTTTSASESDEYSYNATGGDINVQKLETGRYHVEFEGLAAAGTNGGHVQVTANGNQSTYCKVSSWGSGSTVNNLRATVNCYNTTGNLEDSQFSISVMHPESVAAYLPGNTFNEGRIAYAWASLPTNASYSATGFYAHNPDGGINISRSSTGQYSVRFSGLGRTSVGGTAQVTGYGANSEKCSLVSWQSAGPDFVANVGCTDMSGNATDSQFNVAVIPSSAITPIGFAWASDSTAVNYSPSSQFVNNPGGAVTASRISTGQYSITFDGLNTSEDAGGHVQTTAYGNTGSFCNVDSWVTGGNDDLTAIVNCFDSSGSPIDSRFTILALPEHEGDRFEPNDTLALATQLGSGDHTLKEMSILECGAGQEFCSVPDYYLWKADTFGLVNIELLFAHSGGNLDLELLNAAGTVVASSYSTTDNEFLSHAVTASETYYVRVFGPSGWTNENYELRIDAPDVVSNPVILQMPEEALYIGEFIKVPVIIDPATGLGIDDLSFNIPAGEPGGEISLSRDVNFDPLNPDVMLLAGFEPGTYELEAIETASGTTLTVGLFEVTSLWTDDESGPGLWVGDQLDEPTYVAGAGWGGGGTGPQNVNTRPATGTRNVAILFVDTADERYTTNATTMQGHRDRWEDEIDDGVLDGGIMRSTANYFNEVSYGNFNVAADVFGPVSLSGTWTDYFEPDVNGSWAPKAGLYSSAVQAGDSLINYNNYDSVLVVSQEVLDDTTGAVTMSAWPYAWGNTYTTGEGDKNLGVMSMPNLWGVAGTREIYETATHELGHNLGLPDLYSPSVPNPNAPPATRNIDVWDMMHADDANPHFSIANRMMLGWVDPSWIQTFNFATAPAPIDQTVTLSAIENGAPGAGRKAGIEIRIADGKNYYCEYRVRQAGQTADQGIAGNGNVICTDVISDGYTAPISRPQILLLPSDAEGDGGVLANGQTYDETDFSEPGFPVDFRLDVSGIDGSKADVRIRYGVNGKPDPSIRPWPASEDRQWQSPDIEVRNARNQTNPDWFNMPWVNNPNTVVASVKNSGMVNAPQVRVNFYVKDYNVGGAPETFIGSDVQDINANGTVEFTTSWVPPREGHFCIVVRIPIYQTPTTPSVVEMTEFNNLAQSNYNRFISATASPGSREITTIAVGNPFSERTQIALNVSQSDSQYRTYIGNRWLELDPGETRHIPVMYEFSGTQFSDNPNHVEIVGLIRDPRGDDPHSFTVMGGVDTQVVSRLATDIVNFTNEDGALRGQVIIRDGGAPANFGKVMLATTLQKEDGSLTKVYDARDLTAGGFFAFSLPQDPNTVGVQVHYLGTSVHAASDTKCEGHCDLAPTEIARSPKVSGVTVASSKWSNEFIDGIDPANGLGFSMENGANQLAPLPWPLIDRIYVHFDENITNWNAENVSLTGTHVEEYAFQLSLNGSIGMLELKDPINLDELTLFVNDAVSDLGGSPLDGEWLDGVSSFSSGNNDPGGHFFFRFNVLPGDQNRSGAVSVDDVFGLRAGLGRRLDEVGYSQFADLNGTAMLAVNDLGAIRENLGKSLAQGRVSVAAVQNLFNDREIQDDREDQLQNDRHALVDAAVALEANALHANALDAAAEQDADDRVIDSLDLFEVQRRWNDDFDLSNRKRSAFVA